MAKRPMRKVRGGELHGRRPDWRPLLGVAPDEILEFMWMFRVDLEDGSVAEAYKHSWTRRYLHLDGRGRAYVFLGRGWYGEVDPQELLSQVLDGCQTR